MVSSPRSTRQLAWRPLLAAVCCLSVLVTLVSWGGTASPGPRFVLGVAVLCTLVVVFAGFGWWLLSSPLPPGAQVRPSSVQVLRPLAAVLVLSSGLVFTAAGLWDEVWHRKFGGFGNDFFWPPHLLLYGSIGLIALVALLGLLAIAVRGSGGLRERFRQEPLLGVIALISSGLIVAAPSDELWHRIYGQDITAWSLPHVLLAGGIAVVMLTAVPLALWGPQSRGLVFRQVVALVLIAWATTVLLQVGTAEWEGIKRISSGGDAYRSAFWQRPEWLYPVVVVTVALLCGRLAQCTTGHVLAATLVALIVLGARFGMLLAFGGAGVGIRSIPHLMILPAMLVLDLWRWRFAESRWLFGHLAASLTLVLVALPVMAYWMIYPRVNLDTVPGMVFWGLVMGAGAGWVGAQLGVWLRGLEPAAVGAVVPSSRRFVLGGVVLALLSITVAALLAKAPV